MEGIGNSPEIYILPVEGVFFQARVIWRVGQTGC